MEKRDIIVIVVAVFIVLIMAMYVKPLVTGKPVQLIPDELSGLFGGGNQTEKGNITESSNPESNFTELPISVTGIEPPMIESTSGEDIVIQGENFSESMNVSFSHNGTIKEYSAVLTNSSLQISNVSLPEGDWTITVTDIQSGMSSPALQPLTVGTIVTPVPTWDGKPVTVGIQNDSAAGYIYPRLYPESSNPIYSFTQTSVPLMSYSNFSGKYPVKTNSFYIPTGYWEIWYSVEVDKSLNEPKISAKSGSIEITESGKKSFPERMDSISILNPRFSIEVKNADTNKIVRSITPPGGLNPRLWEGDFASPDPVEFDDEFKPPSPQELEGEYNWDPRPWKEKFFEGYRSYYLDIDAQNLLSYSVEIKVPDQNPSNATNNTTNISTQQYYPVRDMEVVIDSYITSYNGNISDPFTFHAITTNLSDLVLTQHSRDQIFQNLYRMKTHDITIDSFKKTDDFIQGPAGSIKGNLYYTKNGVQKSVFVDIPFSLQTDGWKMNNLMLINT